MREGCCDAAVKAAGSADLAAIATLVLWPVRRLVVMIPARFSNVVFGFLLSGLMTLIVTGVTIAQQPDPTIGRWFAAFATGWVVTFPTVLVVAPIVRRLTAKLIAPEPAAADIESTGAVLSDRWTGPLSPVAYTAAEVAEIRRNGDPRISPETKEAVRKILDDPELSEQWGVWVDELTASDFDDLDTNDL